MIDNEKETPGMLGWAVSEDGRIRVKTVHDTRRGAIINWLCTERGLMATTLADDLIIEKEWRQHRGAGITVLQVCVMPAYLVENKHVENHERIPHE